MRVYIFGTGALYRRYKHLFENMDIIGFIDNNPDKWGKEFEGSTVLSPVEAVQTDFDYILLVSIYYKEMRSQLLEMGVECCKIIDKEHKGFFEGISLTEEYIFSDGLEKSGKNVLMFSHVLNLTGAPVVFCRLAKILKENGYNVTVVAEKNSNLTHGVLLYQLLREQISVIIVPAFALFDVEKYAASYDFFWVCTVLLHDIVERLTKLKKNVYWWLHETEDIYEKYKEELIYPQSENLYVLSGGWMAAESFEKHFGKSVFRNLMYGMPPISVKAERKIHFPLKFGLIASYCTRKGQDVLLEAIKKNLQNWMNVAEFYFVGEFPDIKKKEYAEIPNVYLVGELEPKMLDEFYDKIDVLVTPSLYDPMPVVVTEAMQHGIVCLVSDRVGQARYITPFVDGMVCRVGDVEDLEDKINWIIANRDKVMLIGSSSVKIYENDFSIESFKRNVIKLLNDTL